MIGYYVHHHGRGHLHRARTLARTLARTRTPSYDATAADGRVHEVTGLSSLPRPEGWTGPWLQLPWDADQLDPAVAHAADPVDPTAGGALHWAPLHHVGLRRRMARVSQWLEEARPRLVVCDVSQELVLLCRLHGVPVVSVAQPGRRTDLTHEVGLRAATHVVAFWPAGARLLDGLPDGVEPEHLGALSRFVPSGTGPRRTDGARRLVVMGGRGGDAWTTQQVDALVGATPGWEVTVLGPATGWVEDPWQLLTAADVVLTHAGQNAVAEVAAARVPAVVVPAERPFEEQVTTARVLDEGPWPARSLGRLEHPDWPRLLEDVRGLDGQAWTSWCDGRAPERFAELVRRVAAPGRAAAEVAR